MYRLEPDGPQVYTGRQMRALVRRRDGDLCWLCRTPVPEGRRQGDPAQATLDHVIERARGGGDFLANLRLTHQSCNNHRSNAAEPEALTPALALLINIVCAMVEGTS